MTLMVAVALVGGLGRDAAANPLVQMTKTVWGCVDPNMAPVMNDDRNPSRWDAQWVERTRLEGQCVSISPGSIWEPLSQDYNGLTYVAYRGSTGKPGSFWVPTSALRAAAPIAAARPPVPAPPPVAAATPTILRAAPTTSQPLVAPAPVDTTSQAPAKQAQSAPPAQPSGPETHPGSSQQGGGAGGGVMVLLALIFGGWLIRRALRRGKRSGGEAVKRVPREPQIAAVTPAAKQGANIAAPPTREATVVFRNDRGDTQSPARATSVQTKVWGQVSPVWHPPGEPITVAGITVPDGMIYVGRATGQWSDADASFIDPALPVARSSASAGPLSYWPSYRGITPECRRRYLEWLASGKNAADTDLGYVFLYFYGLERRLLLDTPPAGEVRAIVAELLRLRTIYAGNGSFDGYSTRLLEAVAFLQDAVTFDPSTFVPNLAADQGDMPLSLKMAIASEVAAGRPLSFELAAAALFGLRDFRSANRHILDKARAVFLAVLRPRFATAFPNGFALRNRQDSHLALTYRGATAGLTVDLAARAGINGLPDPATLTWTKLLALGAAVAEELAPYAKALAYHPARASALYGLVQCPVELRDTIAPDARRWLEALPMPAAVPFGEVAGHAIGTATAKWTIRHRRQVSEALSAVGYALEPDPDDGAESLEDDTMVQVFRCSGSTASRAMNVASAAAMLVAAVERTAEGGAGGAGGHWLSRVPTRLSLTPDQTARLGARLAWLETTSVTLAKAKRALGDATPEEKEFCAWSATVAAGATGKVGRPQVALLEAIHDALEVPRGVLYADLHAGIGAALAAADEPVLVSDAVAEVVHPIPRPPATEPVDLGSERLASIRAETERVSAMLADIFVEDDAQPQVPEATGEGMLAGLDAEHAALVAQLLSRAEWSRAEFDSAASKAGLMPGGAMETINEWAFDCHGDALLEDGEPVVVNRLLLPIDPEAVAAE